MLKYIFAGLFGLSVLFATSSAKAQAPICAEREQIIQSIKNRFQEVETEYGLDEVTGNYVGVFVQPNTRAFTFIMSPKDQSHTYCVLTHILTVSLQQEHSGSKHQSFQEVFLQIVL
jgi:hypothetical protein